MPKTIKELAQTLIERVDVDGRCRCNLDRADQIIVFGSTALGLERPDSDIDVLCVGDCDWKVKTPSLDLIGINSRAIEDSNWLSSELASHIAHYGVWIRGSPAWTAHAAIGRSAIIQKRQRVAAFMSGLSRLWSNLEACFRVKYAVKLRRETQRLILLRRCLPVPPTRLLDHSWAVYSQSPNDVFKTLQSLAPSCTPEFISGLLTIADENLSNR